MSAWAWRRLAKLLYRAMKEADKRGCDLTLTVDTSVHSNELIVEYR